MGQPADHAATKAKAKVDRPGGFQPAPPWAPFPRDLHQVWMYGLASALLVLVFVSDIVVFVLEVRRGDGSLGAPVLVAFGAYVALIFTGRGLTRSLNRADVVMRFFEWTKWSVENETREAQAKKKRLARAKGMARPTVRASEGRLENAAKQGRVLDDEDEQATDPGYWVEKLSERLARMHRFIELDAPEIIMEHEQRLIRRAVAKLPPAQALSVMRGWPKLREPFARDDHDSDAPAPPKTTKN